MNNPQGTDIERLARAMYNIANNRNGNTLVEFGLIPPENCIFFAYARAALKALSEPSEGMIEAGRDAFFNLTGDGKYQPFEKDFSDGFSAAINHILKEAGE